MSLATAYNRNRITEEKQSELTQLTDAVLVKQFEVNEFDAVVTALESKLSEFSSFLSKATSEKESTLANLNQIEETNRQVMLLAKNANHMSAQAKKASLTVNGTATSVNKLLDQLIFASEMLDKLSQAVTKKKALVTLIPTELVTVLNKATQDANNAFAATITALESCYVATASTDEVANITALGAKQSNELLAFLNHGSNEAPTAAQTSAVTGQAQSEATNVTNKVKALSTALSNLVGAFDTRSEHVNSVTTAQEGLFIAEKALPPLQTVVETLASRLTDLKAEESKSEAFLIDLREQEKSAVEPELTHLEKEIDELDLLLKHLAKLITAAQKRLDEATAKVTDAEKDVAKKKADLNAQQTLLDKANKAVEASRTVVATKQSELDLSDSELDQTLNNITVLTHTPIIELLEQDHHLAVANYQKALEAYKLVKVQLEQAQQTLEIAQENLASLQAGLSAATAAALAA